MFYRKLKVFKRLKSFDLLTGSLRRKYFKLWMWSGAHGSIHNSGAIGLGFDPTPSPGWHFSEALISLLSGNRLKNDFIHLYIVMSS
jgi:hypothetical protein